MNASGISTCQASSALHGLRQDKINIHTSRSRGQGHVSQSVSHNMEFFLLLIWVSMSQVLFLALEFSTSFTNLCFAHGPLSILRVDLHFTLSPWLLYPLEQHILFLN